MKQKIFFVILIGVMVCSLVAGFSCVDNAEKISVEYVVRWSYQFFEGYQSAPDYEEYSDPEGGFIEAVTINTAQINGDDYLLMNFPALSSLYNSRVFIFDMKDPLFPAFLTAIGPVTQEKQSVLLNSIAVSGSTVYGGLFIDKGLWMADIANPSTPIDMGIAPLEMTSQLIVMGDYAYAMGQMFDGVTIADISNPDNARQAARIDTASRNCRLAVSDNLLFVGLDKTLTVYDVTTPSAPKQVGACDLTLTGNLTTELPYPEPGEVHWAKWANIIDLQASGDYVYATFGAGGVRVIDVSNPSAPHEVSAVDTSGFAIMLALKDNLLYVTKSDDVTLKMALSVIDITQPENPQIIDSVITDTWFGFGGATLPHCFMRPLAAGDYIYVAGMNYLDVFKIG